MSTVICDNEMITIHLTKKQKEELEFYRDGDVYYVDKSIFNKFKSVSTDDTLLKQEWIHRLVKLTGIDTMIAKEICDSKIEYKSKCLRELEERKGQSNYRSKLIRKLKMTNPLKEIKNREHAIAIIKAHKRHTNTNYEFLLKAGKVLRDLKLIDSAYNYARINHKEEVK